jgi:hypothetical protein
VARSTHPASSRFAASGAAPSRFERHVGSETANDYWVSSSQLINGPVRARRAAPLASDIVAPLEESPRYYALAWQILLWLACAALAVMVAFG